MKFNLSKSKILNNWHVKILSLAVAVILYYVNYYNNLDVQTIKVPLVVLYPKEEYALSAQSIPEVVFTITGNKALGLDKLGSADFEAIADLTDKKNIRTDVMIPLNIRYEKKGKALVLEPMAVSLKPERVAVKVEKRITKRVALRTHVVNGTPPEGYRLTGYTLIPDTVLISGPESRVIATLEISTEPISLENMKKSFFMRVKPDFSLHPYLDPAEEIPFEFAATIEEIQAEKEITDIPVIAGHIDDSLALAYNPPVGTVRVRANSSLLAGLNAATVRMTVNCENSKQPGKYVLRILVEVPQDVLLLSYTPEEVLIDLIQRK